MAYKKGENLPTSFVLFTSLRIVDERSSPTILTQMSTMLLSTACCNSNKALVLRCLNTLTCGSKCTFSIVTFDSNVQCKIDVLLPYVGE